LKKSDAEPKDIFPREIPYHRFREFIALDADRFAILKILLEELRLNFVVSRIAGSSHFFVYPEGLISVNPTLAMIGCPPEITLRMAFAKSHIDTVLVSHYDRTTGSQGANDNSVAVFELLKAALALKKDNIGGWLIIFTDKEELTGGQGLKEQGSYSLAKGLKNVGLDKAQIFIFDCCGVGDTLVISTAVDHLLRGDLGFTRSKFLVGRLRERALKTARNLRLEKVLLVPTPFSDDAGFLCAGLTAQMITVLPSAEAASLAFLLRTKPGFADALVSKDVQDSHEKDFIPRTWLCINSPADTYETLTPQHFQKITDFACALAGK
jgi:hypothetical protein